MADILDDPVLTMEEEWLRNDQWTDWQGKSYSGAEEWQYVTRPMPSAAVRSVGGSGVGGRDVKGSETRDGWTPQMFREKVNAHIRQRWEEMGKESPDLMLLTTLEVLAIRLYTGPAYQMINAYLRELAKLGSAWRKRLSHMHQMSYSSTVEQLVDGLRKLVRINDETSFGKRFRGIRGELPEAFWLKDAFGCVVATDFAFMSTSEDQAVCQGYMSRTQKNVLFEIQCAEESAEGFHSGADVSMLSQFPAERETLFPPMTMLQVQMGKDQDRPAEAQQEVTTESGAVFVRIPVKPTFV